MSRAFEQYHILCSRCYIKLRQGSPGQALLDEPNVAANSGV